jgi:hypothetical protein
MGSFGKNQGDAPHTLSSQNDVEDAFRGKGGLTRFDQGAVHRVEGFPLDFGRASKGGFDWKNHEGITISVHDLDGYAAACPNRE